MNRAYQDDSELKEFTAPAALPVLLADQKDQLGIDANDASHDNKLKWLINAVRQSVEEELNRSLIETEWDQYLRVWPGQYCYQGGYQSQEILVKGSPSLYSPYPIRVKRSPLRSVTEIRYVDVDGAEQTVSSANYIVDTAAEPGEISPAYGQAWPAARGIGTANMPKPIRVRFKAGYGTTAASVPDSLRVPILMIVGHLFEHREAFTEANLSEVGMAVRSFISQKQIFNF